MAYPGEDPGIDVVVEGLGRDHPLKLKALGFDFLYTFSGEKKTTKEAHTNKGSTCKRVRPNDS